MPYSLPVKLFLVSSALSACDAPYPLARHFGFALFSAGLSVVTGVPTVSLLFGGMAVIEYFRGKRDTRQEEEQRRAAAGYAMPDLPPPWSYRSYPR